MTWLDKLADQIDGQTAITPESVQAVLWLTNRIRKNRGDKELTLSEAVESARAFRASPEYHQVLDQARRQSDADEAALCAAPTVVKSPPSVHAIPMANHAPEPQPRPLPDNVRPIRQARIRRAHGTYSYLGNDDDD